VIHLDRRGVVIDTMVFSRMFVERPNLQAENYRRVIGQLPVLLAFQMVAELRFGALRSSWGELRRRRLERRIAELAVVQPDDDMMTAWAQLRVDCQRIGHGLAAKIHDGDRWIAATARRLDVPLVSDDSIFQDAPGIRLLTSNEVTEQ
jgi:predicted nucleic acid-binding protein